MKKQISRRICRVASCFMMTAMLPSVLLAVPPSPLSCYAEEVAPDARDDEYEAKKQAYREKLMADDVTTDDLLIGSWVSFYPFEKDSYDRQLDQMAAAGINFNIFPRDFGSGNMFDEEYWNNIENQYAKRNMVYLMNGSMTEEHVALGAKYAADKKHCVGYHVVDEPTGDRLPEVASQVRRYREADGTRYPLVNLFPSYAPEWALGGTYKEHVSRFVELAGSENIEYLSHDFYSFQAGATNMGIFADMEVIRSVAYENGKLKTHAFPQSTAWNGMRMPNIDEMRWNVYAYLSYGFKALSWFNLVCPGSSDTEGEGFRDSLIYRDGTIRDPELFAAWSELNWEVRGLSSVLMNLDTVHAYHVRKTVGTETLPRDFFLQPVKKGDDFLISVMEPKQGDDRYIMIFNKKYNRSVTSQFTLSADGGVQWLEYFDPFTGEYVPVQMTDGVISEAFRPGEGRLYRLRYDNPPMETEAETEKETIETTTDAGAAITDEPAVRETVCPETDTDAVVTDTPSMEETASAGGSGCSSSLARNAWLPLAFLLSAVFIFKRRRTADKT